jgi:anaerobic ribonucleoside-triphosphate reductase
MCNFKSFVVTRSGDILSCNEESHDAINKKIPVLVYSRVVGYIQPVQSWNNGKREEFEQRKEYSMEKIKLALDDSTRPKTEVFNGRI